MGSAYVTRALLPALKRRYPAGSARNGPMRNGHVVFVGSMAGQFPVYGYCAYAATKFAVRGFAEGLQMELAAHPIRVTLAHPADTDTPGYAAENQQKVRVPRFAAPIATTIYSTIYYLPLSLTINSTT